MLENGQHVIEGKEHMSFKCYQQTYKLLIEDSSSDSVFALCFFNIAMESYFKIRSDGKCFIQAGEMGNRSS